MSGDRYENKAHFPYAAAATPFDKINDGVNAVPRPDKFNRGICVQTGERVCSNSGLPAQLSGAPYADSADGLRSLLINMRYDGTNYHGWQIQKNALTVQEVFQTALYKILGASPDIKGCSRTDTGVHANMFCVSVKTSCPIDCFKLTGALNALLPRDIAVHSCREVDMDFHARYSCKSKRYVYNIYNYTSRNPFWEAYSLHYPKPLDETMLDREAQDYVGTHDFAALCGSKSDVEDTVRTVKYAQVTRDGDMVRFTVEADGFLYNMVRIMVGTLLRIAQGKISPGSIPDILLSRDRRRAGQTAPAQGLFLDKVNY